jgi:hypothetical protein
MLVLKCNDFRNQHFFYKKYKDEQQNIIDRTISFVKKEKLKMPKVATIGFI